MHLTVDSPDRLSDVHQGTKKELEFEVKIDLSTKLFQAKRISSGNDFNGK
jgi:hypothetical protein